MIRWCTLIATILALTVGSTSTSLSQDETEPPPTPQPRPEALDEIADPPPEDEPVQTEPAPAADRIYQTACPALLSGRIVGELQPPISEDDGQCSVANPISLEAIVVNGHEIALPGAPLTNCTMATAFADWAEQIDSYARGVHGTRIESLATGPGYVCRLRYGADEGFVSEHARGNAIDVASLTLSDGEVISVLDDWSVAPLQSQAKLLGFAHGAACSVFTTVLGPEANSAHEDHFHFDLGCHGQNCRAVICQ